VRTPTGGNDSQEKTLPGRSITSYKMSKKEIIQVMGLDRGGTSWGEREARALLKNG